MYLVMKRMDLMKPFIRLTMTNMKALQGKSWMMYVCLCVCVLDGYALSDQQLMVEIGNA